jgi:hypothetical protein
VNSVQVARVHRTMVRSGHNTSAEAIRVVAGQHQTLWTKPLGNADDFEQWDARLEQLRAHEDG